MSIYMFVVALLLLAVNCAAQTTDDPFDDAHECDSFRKCKDCSTLEWCLKPTIWSLNRWWISCPSNTPYCNPYSARCEATITPICQSLTPS